MYKAIRVRLHSVSPTIIHSGRTANPLDPMSQLLKTVTSKRLKTDEDQLLIGDIEWVASFYPSEPGEMEIKSNKLSFTGFGVPNWPGNNVESMLVKASKAIKLGDKFKAGIMCEGIFPIDFGQNGRGRIEDLFHDPEYADVRRVKVKTSTVMRTRPIFHEWKLDVTVKYLPNMVNESQVLDSLEYAGTYVGLSDNRPKYGRFTVETLAK